MYIASHRAIGQNKVGLEDIWQSMFFYCRLFVIIYQFLNNEFLYRYTHVEAECPFISFDDLLDRLEDLIVDVVERVLASPVGPIVYELNPDFKVFLK